LAYLLTTTPHAYRLHPQCLFAPPPPASSRLIKPV
jgi:hypothetical protein